MEDAPIEHWQALGRAVLEARKLGGYGDTKQWAAKVGRSSRVLLGLERGEPAGPKTLEAIAKALSWDMSVIRGYLADPAAMALMMAKHRTEQAEKALAAQSGRRADRSSLDHFSDQELLDEIRDRWWKAKASEPGENITDLRRQRVVQQGLPVTQAAGTTSPRKPDPDPESQDDGTMEPS